MTAFDHRRRWQALIALCVGVLMIVLDTTIVTVALPSIQTDLGFSQAGLVWVVNAYMLSFGGLLLLGGRLGDLYGHRRLFLLGLALFTLASLACGMAGTQALLIIARAVQGIGGAVVTAVALSLIMMLFTDDTERAKAMGVYGFVCSAGGCIGSFLGGVLTSRYSWHSIFLVNLPIGLGVSIACLRLLPRAAPARQDTRLDIGGALTITGSLMLAVYAVVDGNAAGWGAPSTLAMLAASALLFAAFLVIEQRVAAPLVPLALFRLPNLRAANLVGVLWAAAMFAWFVLAALYLQLVLGYGPLQVGLAFVPADLIMAIFSLGLSARIVLRHGLRLPMWAGLLCAAAGLALFARAPLHGSFVVDVLPGMLLLGFGAGIAFNPVLLAAMNDVTPADAGLASGIVNTAFMMGGALGLAVLASLAEARTQALAATLGAGPEALLAGYRLAFVVATGIALLAAAIAAGAIRPPAPAEVGTHSP